MDNDENFIVLLARRAIMRNGGQLKSKTLAVVAS